MLSTQPPRPQLSHLISRGGYDSYKALINTYFLEHADVRIKILVDKIRKKNHMELAHSSASTLLYIVVADAGVGLR